MGRVIRVTDRLPLAQRIRESVAGVLASLRREHEQSGSTVIVKEINVYILDAKGGGAQINVNSETDNRSHSKFGEAS